MDTFDRADNRRTVGREEDSAEAAVRHGSRYVSRWGALWWMYTHSLATLQIVTCTCQGYGAPWWMYTSSLSVILIKLFLSLSLPPVFEFTATAQMAMGSGFLVLSPNIIKTSLPGHCPLPFRQWPVVGKS